MNAHTGNGFFKKIAVGILTVMALGALTTALTLWKEAPSYATKLEVQESLSLRDQAFSQTLNQIGKDLSRIEAKLDLLLEERAD